MTGYHNHAELKQGRFGKPADVMLLLFLTSEGVPDRPEGDHEKTHRTSLRGGSDNPPTTSSRLPSKSLSTQATHVVRVPDHV